MTASDRGAARQIIAVVFGQRLRRTRKHLNESHGSCHFCIDLHSVRRRPRCPWSIFFGGPGSVRSGSSKVRIVRVRLQAASLMGLHMTTTCTLKDFKFGKYLCLGNYSHQLYRFAAMRDVIQRHFLSLLLGGRGVPIRRRAWLRTSDLKSASEGLPRTVFVARLPPTVMPRDVGEILRATHRAG